jgi:hypothetical protein
MTDRVEQTAYHEAGHAAMWRRWGRFEFAKNGYTLITESGYGRTGTTRQAFGPPRPPVRPPATHELCLIVIAGRAAETIQYPESDELLLRWGSDEEQLRESLIELHGLELSESSIAERMAALLDEACLILREDWAGVRALAEHLATLSDPIGLDGAAALRIMDDALSG